MLVLFLCTPEKTVVPRPLSAAHFVLSQTALRNLVKGLQTSTLYYYLGFASPMSLLTLSVLP